MSSPRLATIPFEHMEAEIAAFPLASEASFRLGRTSLNPDVNNDPQLWRDAEKEIMEALPSVHLEEASAFRDRLWFPDMLDTPRMLQPVPLVTYLQRLAESYLDESGRPIDVVNPDSTKRGRFGSEGRLRWCWMCKALPPDLLLAARGITKGDENSFPLHPLLQQLLLDQGFAESHLHQGSALDFSLAWAALMRDLGRTQILHSDFVSVGACFQDGRNLGLWLLYAAVVRLILAKWLFEGPQYASQLSALFTYTRNSHNRQCESGNAPNATSFLGRRLDAMETEVLSTLLTEVLNGKFSELRPSGFFAGHDEVLNRRFASTRSLYSSLIGAPPLVYAQNVAHDDYPAIQDSNSEPSDHLDDSSEGIKPLINIKTAIKRRSDIFASDPIARVVGWQPTMTGTPEDIFISEALRYTRENEDFARLFWQMIRIRCLLYRHVVERPLTPGLQWFMRFFSRIKPLRRNIPPTVLFETAARLSGKNFGLRALEVRLGTDDNQTACLNTIRAVEKAAASSELTHLEVGAVFHFSRKRGGGWEQGRMNAHGLDHSYPTLPDPLFRPGSKLLKEVGNPSGFRFARFYLEQRRHAQALVNVFQMYPDLLRTVRGIDLCTDEAGVPVWVMAPIMRWVRETAKMAIVALCRSGHSAIRSFRTSVHAGEDFVHLMSGLRRIDQTVSYLRLEEGDRLGHALALGSDAPSWCDSVSRVVQTSEERLLDLVWEWDSYAKHNVKAENARLAFVSGHITRLATRIFNEPCTPEIMINLVDQLHDEQRLRAAGFPDQPMLGVNSQNEKVVGNLIKAYLCDEQVWRRGRISEIINLRGPEYEHEKSALIHLQNGLRRRIGAIGLTIEVNPSSNVVIGDLGHLEVHPLWRLRPIVPDTEAPSLSICIGSDNPLTLATTLPNEYQLLFDALVLRGESQELAMRWLDEVRDAGMRARFTLPRDVARIDQRLIPNVLTIVRAESPP